MSIQIQIWTLLNATKQKFDCKLDPLHFKLEVWEIPESFRSKKGKNNKEEEVRNRRKVKIQLYINKGSPQFQQQFQFN